MIGLRIDAVIVIGTPAAEAGRGEHLPLPYFSKGPDFAPTIEPHLYMY